MTPEVKSTILAGLDAARCAVLDLSIAQKMNDELAAEVKRLRGTVEDLSEALLEVSTYNPTGTQAGVARAALKGRG